MTLQEAEEAEPHLAKCALTIWGVLAYQHLEASPRRTMDPAQAAVWVFPPYAAWETNW